jgi:hypothetical protein
MCDSWEKIITVKIFGLSKLQDRCVLSDNLYQFHIWGIGWLEQERGSVYGE